MQTLFYLLLLLVLYVYFGYPCVLFILSRIRPRAVKKEAITPHVTIITAAYNEADHIEATIRNKFAQEYPADKLTYVVISDCSDDGTDDIVRRLQQEYSSLVFLRQENREGKTAALNRAIAWIRQHGENDDEFTVGNTSSQLETANSQLSTESPRPHAPGPMPDGDSCIAIFSDANSIYKPGAIANLARNFADPEVGYVTGKMVYRTTTDSGVSEGCSMYMTYENLLRSLETRTGSIIGVDGGIDACRVSLYEDMDSADLPDFVLPLTVLSKGYRVVYEPKAVVSEEALHCHESEFSMRVRVSLRAFRTLWQFKYLCDIRTHKMDALKIISHKSLRYLMGYAQIALGLINFILIPVSTFYHVLFALQIMFYIYAFIGYICEHNTKVTNRLCYPFYYICLLNLAALVASIKFIAGEKTIVWNPRKG